MPQTASQAPAATERPNILHGYTNYTYSLQLWAITSDAFNKIAKGGITVGSEAQILENGQVLISNGGFGTEERAKRSGQFPFDMVIDNLVIESIVGKKGASARGVDTLTLKFDIIEPYTVTLINRLVKLAGEKGQNQDFKTLMYAFKIDFLGYDDEGTPVKVDKATKWLPFTMLNMQFNITNKGAVYTCQGIPVQNLVMSMIDNNIPFHIELQGVTVKDLFDANSITLGASQGAARTDAPSIPNNASTTITKGIAKALNDNEKYKKENTKSITIANEYAFEFDEDLLNAKIIDPSKVQDQSRSNAPTRNAAGDAARAQARLGTINLEVNDGIYRTQAGTKITDFIQSIMLTTDFMKNQVSEGAPSRDKPFIGIQILPKLEIMGYDPKTNFFARKVTYVVKKFAYYGEDHPNLPQQTYPPESVVKKYEYLFTGNNRDVKKVNLDYKIVFFDVRNGVKRNQAQEAGDGSGQDASDNTNDPNKSNSQNTSDFGRPSSYMSNGDAARNNSGGITNDVKSMTLAEMVTKLFDNGVDLLTLDIEIVGDPDWIQQDNVLYGLNVPKAKTLSNGVINFQDSVTCFEFTFKSPTKDYDDVTGIFNVTETDTAKFSGIYQVLTVSSKFSKGMFTQSLTNVRLRLQTATDTRPTSAATRTRTTTTPATNDGR